MLKENEVLLSSIPDGEFLLYKYYKENILNDESSLKEHGKSLDPSKFDSKYCFNVMSNNYSFILNHDIWDQLEYKDKNDLFIRKLYWLIFEFNIIEHISSSESFILSYEQLKPYRLDECVYTYRTKNVRTKYINRYLSEVCEPSLKFTYISIFDLDHVKVEIISKENSNDENDPSVKFTFYLDTYNLNILYSETSRDYEVYSTLKYTKDPIYKFVIMQDLANVFYNYITIHRVDCADPKVFDYILHSLDINLSKYDNGNVINMEWIKSKYYSLPLLYKIKKIDVINTEDSSIMKIIINFSITESLNNFTLVDNMKIEFSNGCNYLNDEMKEKLISLSSNNNPKVFNMTYEPKPIDTKAVVLSEDLLELTEELADSEKEYDRNTAMESIKLLVSLGYTISKN